MSWKKYGRFQSRCHYGVTSLALPRFLFGIAGWGHCDGHAVAVDCGVLCPPSRVCTFRILLGLRPPVGVQSDVCEQPSPPSLNPELSSLPSAAPAHQSWVLLGFFAPALRPSHATLSPAGFSFGFQLAFCSGPADRFWSRWQLFHAVAPIADGIWLP